jgi:hypothetical protein
MEKPSPVKRRAAIKRPVILVLITLLLLASGCVSSSTSPTAAEGSATIPLATETIAPSVTPVPPTGTLEPSPTFTGTATQVASGFTQYQLDVNFDYTNDWVDVQEQITVFNRWPDTLNTLVLVVEPNHTPGVFTLNSLVMNGSSLQSPDGYTLEGHELRISLPSPLIPGQGLTLSINYHLDLPLIQSESGTEAPTPFGYSDHQTNLVSWYPYLAAYDPGSGWLVHDRYYFGEHEVYDVADYTVNLTLVNPPADLKIAASAPAETQGGVLHYSLPRARTFAFSASEMYIVESQVVGDTTITSYSFPWDQAAGEAALHDTARALELYSNLFGSYDRPSLNVVEAAFLDGMEYDGLFFLSYGFYNIWDGTPSSYLTAIAVHETAHQWWYGKVGSDQALEPWLDEALSTYCERLFYENDSPLSMDWWLNGRIGTFSPNGFINKPVKDYVNYEPYRSAVYLNGESFFDDLRVQVGDEAFFAFLSDYADQFANQRATADDFFAVLRQHTQADLTALTDQYFDPDYPQK